MKPRSTVEMHISTSVETELTPPERNSQAHGFATETAEVAQKLSSEASNKPEMVEAFGDQAEVDVSSERWAETWDEKAPELPPAEVHKRLPPNTVRGASPTSAVLLQRHFEWPWWLQMYNMKTVLFCLLRPQLTPTVFCCSIGV